MCSTFVMHQYLGCVVIETNQSLHQLYYRLNIALLYALIHFKYHEYKTPQTFFAIIQKFNKTDFNFFPLDLLLSTFPELHVS